MINDSITLYFNSLLYLEPLTLDILISYDMVPFWFLWWTRITSSSLVTENAFKRIRNSSLLSISNEFPKFILVTVLLSWRDEIMFVSYQSWWVSLIRYDNGITASPMRVASSCTIWDLTSYQFFPTNKGIVAKNYLLWEVSLWYYMECSSIMESTHSWSNSVALAVSYYASASFSSKIAQQINAETRLILVVLM